MDLIFDTAVRRNHRVAPRNLKKSAVNIPYRNICTFDLSNSQLSMIHGILQYIGNQINLVKGVFSSYGGMISDEHDIIRVVIHFTLMSEVGKRPCLSRIYC